MKLELDKFELKELRSALEQRRERLTNMQKIESNAFTKDSLEIIDTLLNKLEE